MGRGQYGTNRVLVGRSSNDIPVYPSIFGVFMTGLAVAMGMQLSKWIDKR